VSSRRANPRPLAAALGSIRAAAEPATPLAAVQSAWTEAAGERIAAEALPVAERDGVVTIACRAATWAQELDLLQDDLLARLRSALPQATVERLRFVVKPDPFAGTN
jgi:predicted nucleic acid-binding Zn ribbon protein